MTFQHFALPPTLLQSLERMKFTTATPVQAQSIPLALAGRDILGSAQTGTGKTGAYAIPLIARLLSNPRGSALVLAPTREIAMQVMQVINQMLGGQSAIKAALLIGGDSMPLQIQQLRARPRIFVGTPGRINDHLDRGTLNLRDTDFLVLDETDRMLDMGFSVQLEKIFKYLPRTRQTLMFSATLPPAIIKMASQYLASPERVAAGSDNVAATNVTQVLLPVSQNDKYEALVEQLEARGGSVIIFVRTKFGADRLASRLSRQSLDAQAIHGDLQQRKRERAIAEFRAKKYRVLVATDIAARGLDIPHIEHVINYDLPQCPEDYIHRIGRTARAGAKGEAISFLSHEEKGKWRAIEKLIRANPSNATIELRDGFKQGKPKGKGDYCAAA